MEIGPLLVEQRRIGDEYRVVEKAVQLIHGLLRDEELIQPLIEIGSRRNLKYR